MIDLRSHAAVCDSREYRFVLALGVLALAVTSVPYVLGAASATDDRLFGGFVYAIEDCYSYLAKMRLGAEGAWLFRFAYTPEPHRGAFFFPLHLLLGKVAASIPFGDMTSRLVWAYHGARMILGLALLLTVYRFLAVLTEQVAVRRLAWLLVTYGGGLGWLLVVLGQPGWLGSMPLDFILPEGFTFLVLYAFPHIALARIIPSHSNSRSVGFDAHGMVVTRCDSDQIGPRPHITLTIIVFSNGDSCSVSFKSYCVSVSR